MVEKPAAGVAGDLPDGTSADAAFLTDGGETGALIRSIDWTGTPLGPLERWPQSLRTAVSICLRSRFPILLFWGPDLVMIYNDAYRPMIGIKHPRSMGQPGLECWAEIRDVIEPMLQGVMLRGEATWSEDLMLPLVRHQGPEECYFTFTYSPIHDESGGVGGVFCAVMETTERVIEERRLRLLNSLAETTKAKTPGEACAHAAALIARDPSDVPFALLYLLDESARVTRLAGAASVDPGSPRAPREIGLDDDHAIWSLGENVPSFAEFEAGPGRTRAAVILPIERSGGGRPFGFIVAGLSPLLPRNASYDRFHKLLAASLSRATSNAAAHEEERSRADALAEIDRAKTTFFGNVSHEFRTPLTLMLAPIQDMLSLPAGAPVDRAAVELLHRNALRLLKLVNTMLEFSRIEAGRVEAVYEPVDLSALTVELASSFRAAIQQAGLAFVVDCPPSSSSSERVYVDRDMWEKIVLNLLSNALKFTFEGSISVRMRMTDGAARLEVADTGTGIAEHELPRLFERFHRIEGARSRSHEGSGIGLAFIQELVRLHGGEVSVTSRAGEGSTFTVSIPRGVTHLSRGRVGTPRRLQATTLGVEPYVTEALRWNRSVLNAAGAGELPALGQPPGPRERIVFADDNSDMRDYVTRLLEERWAVEAFGDGGSALASIRRRPPALVLTDLMMPGLDGLGLVQVLRADPTLRAVPVIILSARAGEEETARGLSLGANDYIAKPFSGRELLVRVASALAAARLARELHTLEEAQNRRMSALFEHAPVGIAVLRGPEHVFEVANPHYAELVPGHALLGLSIRQALPELEGQGIYELLDKVYQTGEPFLGRSVRLMLDDREGRPRERFFDFAYQAMPGPDGKPESIMVVVFEVTDLARARRDADAANRAKDEFFAILGHELRNPLAPISTALHLMRLRDDGRLAKERAVIERQVAQISRLVDDLLDVSRMTRGMVTLSRAPIELFEVVTRAAEMAGPLLEQRRHRFNLEVPAEGLVVDGDGVRLAQVISNLLANAAKYTEPGGQVTVSADRQDGRVRLRVADTGIGLTPEMLSRIFEPFVQEQQALDRAQGGLGLGLTIVSTLVQLHGGVVTADSAGRGAGSTFTVELPLSEAAGRPADQAAPSPPTPRRLPGTVRVLVVDDNQDSAEMLAEALELLGCQTLVAHDGVETIRVASDFQPQVALLDIGLPVMDGYELADRLRRAPGGEHLRLVAVTGYGQESDRIRAEQAGFDAHLVKPVALDAVADIIERFVASPSAASTWAGEH
jgi:signal transduction histidine kinase